MWSKCVLWRNVEKSVIWRNVSMLFCCKTCFVAIYAVLSQNLFCRDLRAFVWRKIGPKIVRVEKKRQISGMLKVELKRVRFNDGHMVQSGVLQARWDLQRSVVGVTRHTWVNLASLWAGVLGCTWSIQSDTVRFDWVYLSISRCTRVVAELGIWDYGAHLHILVVQGSRWGHGVGHVNEQEMSLLQIQTTACEDVIFPKKFFQSCI